MKDVNLPALDRGLRLLEFLFNKGGQARTSEIKDLLADVGDASLHRLLTAMESGGWLTRPAAGLWQLSQRPRSWASGGCTTIDQSKHFLGLLCNQTGESGACVHLDADRLICIASHPIENKPSPLALGGILHWENDHAGAMAALQLASPSQQLALLKSSYSRMPADSDLEKMLSTMRFRNETLLDQSCSHRPDVRRLARAFCIGEESFAIFLVISVQTPKEKILELATELDRCCGHLQKLQQPLAKLSICEQP